MTLKARFGLIVLGVILFLAVTPVLVLYARGFKVDFHNRQIVKTGTLVVKTEPNKATIFLNDQKQASLTPSNVRFLIPDNYDVRIEKDDYQTWTKRLSVKSQLVTWANHNRDFITLFLQLPKLKQIWETDLVRVSKTHDEIVFSSNEQVHSINVNNNNLTELGGLASVWLTYLPTKTIVDWQNSAQVYQRLVEQTLPVLSDKQISQIRRVETNGTHVLLQLDTDLYSLDNLSPALLANNVLAFTLTSEDVWYIQAETLKLFNFAANNPATIAENVPKTTSGKIIRSDNQVYLILDQGLYVLNEKLEKIYDNVSNAAWDKTSDQLLLANANEILLYDPDKKNTNLILRSTTPISNPTLNTETGYVFFQSEGLIKAIELDGRDHRNIYEITESIGDFVLSEDGQTLYTFNNVEIKQYTIR